MSRPQRLSAKLVGIQIFALVVALASIGSTLLVSWRLEGSAAAINDAGSLRMRTYRLAYLTQEVGHGGLESEIGPLIARDIVDFDRVVATLHHGDPVRPLFVPDTAAIAADFAAFDRAWATLKPKLEHTAAGNVPGVTRTEFERFVGIVNRLVVTLERDIAQTTALLRSIQLALVALAIAGAVALIYLAFLFIIRPVHQLEEGLQRMAKGEFGVRLPVESKDEFGALARGFNEMAEHLQELYRTLEGRVAQKTRSLAEQNARLATLYDMTAFLNASNSLENLCRGFLTRLLATTGAAAGAVRLVSREADTLHLFVQEGMDPVFAANEHCLQPQRVCVRRGGCQEHGDDPRARREKEADHDHAAALPRGGLQRRGRRAGGGSAPGARRVQPVLPRCRTRRRPRSGTCWRASASTSESRSRACGSPRATASSRLPRSAICSRRSCTTRSRRRSPSSTCRRRCCARHWPNPIPTRRCASSTRSRPACRNPTPTCANCLSISARGSRKATSNTASARCSPGSNTRPACAPSFASAARRCRSPPTTSCR